MNKKINDQSMEKIISFCKRRGFVNVMPGNNDLCGAFLFSSKSLKLLNGFLSTGQFDIDEISTQRHSLLEKIHFDRLGHIRFRCRRPSGLGHQRFFRPSAGDNNFDPFGRPAGGGH